MKVLAPIALLLCACAAKPCADQAGACLTVHVRGDVPALDALRFDLSGAASFGFQEILPPDLRTLPIVVPIAFAISPAGDVQVIVEARRSGRTAGLGRGDAVIQGNEHVALDLLLKAVDGPSCTDGYRDGDETDVDCGGSCGRCFPGKRCQKDEDCTTGRCKDLSCLVMPAPDPGPVVRSVSPPSGPTTGGITLTIDGEHFRQGPGLAVTIDGVAADGVLWLTETRLQATLPARPGRLGKVDVGVTDPDGQHNVGAGVFSYYYGTADFAAAAIYAAPRGPSGLAAGDVDGDGVPDVVAACQDDGVVAVLLVKGGALKRPAVAGYHDYAVPDGPRAVALADLSGDGLLDFVALRSGKSGVQYQLGKGDGSFGGPRGVATDAGPRALLLQDVSGDGNADLLIAASGAALVDLLLGDGKGGFATAKGFAAGRLPLALAAADLRPGGAVDVLVASYDDDTVGILLNGDGHGGFSDLKPAAAAMAPAALLLQDVSGDGRPDLLIAAAGANQARVGLGKGDGSFSPFADYNVGSGPAAIAAADLDGDGRADLVLGNEKGGDVSVLLNQGDGTFRDVLSYGSGKGPRAVLVLDVDRDGRLDIVTANYGDGNLAVLLNRFR